MSSMWMKAPEYASSWVSKDYRWSVYKEGTSSWEVMENVSGEIHTGFTTLRDAKAFCMNTEKKEAQAKKRFPLKHNYINDKLGNTFYILGVDKDADTLRVEAVATKTVYKNVPIDEFDFERERS